MVKIKIVCPWWGRWEVTRLHCRSMKRFMNESPYEMSYLAVVSKEDKDLFELKDLAFNYGFDVCSHPNLPVSEKLNAGITLGLKDKPDYIMNMGSDDLCSPDIWKIYKPLIEKKTKFFGIDSVHIVDFYTKQAYYLDLYAKNFPVGVLRMIRGEVIEYLWDRYTLKLYPYGVDQGMDTASTKRLSKIGVEPIIIPTNRRVLTAGLKCNTSINHWTHLTTIPEAEKIKFETIKHLMP